MHIFHIFIFIIISTKTFAHRPDWYPKNATDIEAACLRDNPVSLDAWSKIRVMQLDDLPFVRSLMLCLVTNKFVYRPKIGFEAERLHLGLQQATKMNCNIQFIQYCGEMSEHLQPEDLKIFNIIKCIGDAQNEKCTKINN
ncbi:uncharacterized protein LOC142219721 [Haematobia irritans]|uniref:uncharacterized protein LOC142219721 n=1 Tax=Haematobia irritans TaxID=7368 RepID=UPI003F4FCF6D